MTLCSELCDYMPDADYSSQLTPRRYCVANNDVESIACTLNIHGAIISATVAATVAAVVATTGCRVCVVSRYICRGGDCASVTQLQTTMSYC